ncbi:MAG: hypothetical protein M0Z48_11390 [Nitrospiraceae bacterium]|nr:hypothetical protein [Nitrospiraceae bacterium]
MHVDINHHALGIEALMVITPAMPAMGLVLAADALLDGVFDPVRGLLDAIDYAANKSTDITARFFVMVAQLGPPSGPVPVSPERPG